MVLAGRERRRPGIADRETIGICDEWNCLRHSGNLVLHVAEHGSRLGAVQVDRVRVEARRIRTANGPSAKPSIRDEIDVDSRWLVGSSDEIPEILRRIDAVAV